MKRFFLLSLLTALGSSLWAQGIEFRDISYGEALEAARQESKPIFMDAFTEWCGPCKWMSANIFTQEEVGEYFNEKFVCVKFDMEKGEGKDLAEQYGVSAYPTLLFISPEEELLHVQVGAAQDPAAYPEMGEIALDPERNMPYLKANKEEKFDDPEFMTRYFQSFGAANRLEEGDLDRYFAQFPVQEWTETGNWHILQQNARDYNSEVFQKMLEHEELFAEAHGEQAMDFMKRVIFNHLRQEYVRSQKAGEPEAFADTKNAVLDPEKFSAAEEVAFEWALAEHQQSGNWDDYCQICEENVETYYWDQPFKLNNVAWTVFENSENPKNLEMALLWAERAVELKPETHFILDTYANLLLVNGQAKKALETEEQAVKLAKKAGDDTEDYEAVVKKIKEALKS